MRSSIRRIALLALIGTAATEIFRRIMISVPRGDTRDFDRAVRRYLSSQRHGASDRPSDLIAAFTAPALCVTTTVVVAFWLRRRGIAAWLPTLSSPVVAMSVGAMLSRTLEPRSAPSGHEGESSFPSGHTTGLTAEALTVAYVLERETIIKASQAAAILIAPLIGGINRLFRDRHWATDIAAGWTAGIAVASVCASLSEVLRLISTQQWGSELP